jgi:hypothetical protein
MWQCFAALAFLFAAEPSWQTKPPAQWTAEDAKALLAESPWVGAAQLQQIPPRSPYMRRDSGDWDSGIGHGLGIDGTGLFGHEREKLALARAHRQPDLGTIPILWASAAPVRAAETKLGATDVPAWGDDYYAIALLNIPTEERLKAGQLKNLAAIRRPGMKDFKPVRVEVLEHENDLATVVYLFPRSTEITTKDSILTFIAQIGQVFISSYFYPEKMVIDGHLEL